MEDTQDSRRQPTRRPIESFFVMRPKSPVRMSATVLVRENVVVDLRKIALSTSCPASPARKQFITRISISAFQYQLCFHGRLLAKRGVDLFSDGCFGAAYQASERHVLQ